LEEDVQRPSCDHVLIEAQLPARLDHSEELRQGTLLVGYRAQYQGDDASVERPVFARKLVGYAVEDGDWDRRRCCGLLGPTAEIIFGLDGDQVLYGGWVVGEVHSLAGSDLDHAAGETF